jgi:hypothetical protein
MKHSVGILLSALLFAACSPGGDNKPAMEQERATLDKAKQVDSATQQQAQQQKQAADKQTQ